MERGEDLVVCKDFLKKKNEKKSRGGSKLRVVKDRWD